MYRTWPAWLPLGYLCLSTLLLALAIGLMERIAPEINPAPVLAFALVYQALRVSRLALRDQGEG